ncbi:hypothetical protein [Bradyrhizobium japonicum]|uniref:hypothetical protein n=2 Tax=Bradyrhizobium japonicum TaxID=375 RepID=UPI0035A14FB2
MAPTSTRRSAMRSTPGRAGISTGNMYSTSPIPAACRPARGHRTPDEGTQQDKEPDNPNKAGIRIDLTGIGVSRPK